MSDLLFGVPTPLVAVLVLAAPVLLAAAGMIAADHTSQIIRWYQARRRREQIARLDAMYELPAYRGRAK